MKVFIKNNKIEITLTGPTQKFMKTLNNAINKSRSLLNQNTHYLLRLIIAQCPHFMGLPKVHKRK